MSAINPDFYHNKYVILALLGITPQTVSSSNFAKKDMWNHQLKKYNMGDDILKNTSKTILSDIDFATKAIVKYNRTYLYLSDELKANRNLAVLTAKFETDAYSQNEPILKFMCEGFQNDIEISALATMRNIDNLQYSQNLQNNRYFLVDMINLIYEKEIRYKVLRYMNPELLKDKRFVSKLGCFDGLCENFKGDSSFVAFSVENDIGILKKTEIFDEKIVKAIFNSKDYQKDKAKAIVMLFRYIEKFNYDYEELESKISDKKLLHRLFWELAQVASDEFI
ncbi:MAG: hypothetical protein RBT59_06135 [Arcobacteraceae bacterium]|nr:hypothetical protein [Arcobacteraceae bacterium]